MGEQVLYRTQEHNTGGGGSLSNRVTLTFRHFFIQCIIFFGHEVVITVEGNARHSYVRA